MNSPEYSDEREDPSKYTPDALEGMNWWNSISELERAYWLKQANSAVPADARQAFLGAQEKQNT